MVYARNDPKQVFHIIVNRKALCHASIREKALYTKEVRQGERTCTNCRMIAGGKQRDYPALREVEAMDAHLSDIVRNG